MLATMFTRLVQFQHMDRRWIFLGMAIAIFIPMIFPIHNDLVVDRPVQDAFDAVEELPAG